MNNHDDETEVDNDTEGSSGGAIGGKGSHRPPATSSSGGSATQKSRSSQTTGTNSAIAVLNERLLKATKLFGRDHEQEEIINVYNRVKRRESTTSSPNGKKTEFLLIRGSIGTGKSALSERFLLPMVGKDGGYCVTGKFDQLRQLQKPHCFVVEAFTSYAKMVQERGQVETVRRAVNEATTEIESLNLLVKMIPGLAALTGLETKGDVDDAVNKQDDVDSSDEGSYSSNEAASRFKYAVRLLLRSFASVDRPLVLVLEDLHWADEAAMDLLHTLLTDTANQETLFVATYREESDKRNMTTMLKQLQKSEVTVSHIVLKNLDEVSTTNMVVDMLQTDVAYTKPLADLVFSHTKGNAYYIVVFLRALAEGGFLRYDMDAMPQWSWDADEVRVEFGTTMIDVVKNKISCLPDEVLHALKCASCLGSKLDKVILANLMGESSTVAFSYFDLATEKGLLVHCPRRGWAFAHDAIQDAAYSMIPGSDREKFHYDIGLRLWRCFDINELDENIFVVVGQLLAGSRFVEKRKEQIAVARMCLRAGERSVYMSSFQSAFNYLVHGVRLLGTKCWRDEYTLSLNLYNAAAEVAYCSGHSKEVHIFVQEILAHATCLDDTLRGHSANIYAIGSCGRMQEAIHYGIQILSDLGEKFPETQSTTRTFIELQRIRKKLKRKTNESLLRLPIMEDTRKLAAMHMLSQLTTYTFLNAKGLSLTIAFRMVNLSLNCGLSATSCIGFALVGALLCGVNEIEEGYRLGQLGLALQEKFQVRVWLPRVAAIYWLGIHTFKHPLATIITPLRRAQRVGIETGDIEFSLACGVSHVWAQFETRPLIEVEAAYQVLREQMIFYGQETVLDMTKPSLQAIHNLMGRGSVGPTTLSGEVMDEDLLFEMRDSNGKLYEYSHFHLMMLAYLFGDHVKAAEYSKLLRPASNFPFGAIDAALMVFFDGLVALQNARISKKRRRLCYARKQLRRIQYWTQHAPHTFFCRQFLLEAEVAAVSGDLASVYSKYVAAIALATSSGFIFQIALGNELAGKYYLHERKDKATAMPFLREALHHYERWGAKAKFEHLASEIMHA